MGNKRLILFAAAIMLLKPSVITQAAQSPDFKERINSETIATSSEAQKPAQASEQKEAAAKTAADDIIVSVQNSGSNTATDKIVFYMERDMETNRVLDKPKPARITITLKEGSAPVSGISIKSSRNEIKVPETAEGITLSQNNSYSFDVNFWSEGLADGTETMVKGQVYILHPSQSEPIEIPVIASADGLYSYYNSEIAGTFTGTLLNDGSYCNVGQIDLKSANAPVLTIKHLWKPIAASETYPLKLIKLDPDGYFEFPDGSYEKKAELRADGYIEFQIHMKESAFNELKAKAVAEGRNIYQYVPLSELVFLYEGPTGNDDGFLIGGKGASLPITYLLTYTAHSGSSGGGSSSGGSGGGGGGGGGSATLVDTSTYNVARESDNGWKLVDNTWYYYDSNNKMVKGWLLTLDNKWYYMDKDGKMLTGWIKPQDGKWYFLQENGVMLTGWYKTTDGKQYYLQANGVMTTGWFKDGDEKWYYFLTNGEMAKNMTTPDGYYVNGEGVYIP